MKNMTRNLKATMAVLALCVITLCSQTALAQRPGGGGPPSGGGPSGSGNFIEQLAKILGLTDAQQAQIKTIQEQAAASSKPYQDRLKPLLEQAHALVETDVFDEAALRSLAAQMAPIQLELHVISARAESATYNALTPEQKAKLAELRKMMGQHGGGRPGGGGRP